MNGMNDAGVREMEAALDRLGAATRAGADAGFEDRVFAASVGPLRAAREGARDRAVVARIGPAWGGRAALRLAAMVGIAGACAAVWVSSLRPVAPAGPGVTLTAMDEGAVLLAIELPWDERLGSLSARIDLLYADAAALSGGIGSGAEWPALDLGEEESL